MVNLLRWREHKHIIYLPIWGIFNDMLVSCCNKNYTLGLLKNKNKKTRKVCSGRPRGQQSYISFTGLKSKCWQSHAPFSPESLMKNLFPASSSFWCLSTFLVMYLHNSVPCLCGHITFSSFVFSNFPLPLSHKDTCDCV